MQMQGAAVWVEMHCTHSLIADMSQAGQSPADPHYEHCKGVAASCWCNAMQMHDVSYHQVCMLRYSKPAEAIDIMHRVKAMLDPNQIMNPYKFLPRTEHRPQG